MNSKVIFLTEDLSTFWGGPSKSVPAIAFICQENGYDCTLFTTYLADKGVYSNDYCESNNLKMLGFKSTGPDKFRFSSDLFLEIHRTITRDNSNYIIHLNNLWNWPAFVAYYFSFYKNVKVVISPRGAIEEWSMEQNRNLKSLISRLFQRRLFKKSTIHVTSEQEKKMAMKYANVEGDNVYLIPNGIDELTQGKGDSRPNNSATLNFLFMSRLHPKKGVEELLLQWKRLLHFKNSKQKLKLSIAGTGDEGYLATLKNCVRENELEDSVYFLGHVEKADKYNLFNTSDVFVLPTYSENFGIAIAEAAYCRLPIITTTGAPWHLIDKYQCGWWFDMSNDNLYDALNEASSLSRDELRIKGENAHQMIVDNYCWSQLSDSYLKMYRDVDATFRRV